MKKSLSFDDVLIVPKFSFVESRKDVDTSVDFLDLKLKLGIISANMDTVTGVKMASAMYNNGSIGCLHRFNTIDQNVKDFIEVLQINGDNTFVSFGVGNKELERAQALSDVGATHFILDVAHGANINVVKQVKEFRKLFGNTLYLIVGNFATNNSIQDFMYHLGGDYVDGVKVGIGGGSHCTTRVVTGAGVPTFGSVLDCSRSGYPIIADGGIRNSGDVAKALGAGASMVMVGKLLAGTDETPGDFIFPEGKQAACPMKKYRGSASQESYSSQGKTSEWRTAEGESSLVPCKGPVKDVLQQLDAGLRSAMSYVGCKNLDEFKNNIEFVEITSSGYKESRAHGKEV